MSNEQILRVLLTFPQHQEQQPRQYCWTRAVEYHIGLYKKILYIQQGQENYKGQVLDTWAECALDWSKFLEWKF